jgi:hypothetical protein
LIRLIVTDCHLDWQIQPGWLLLSNVLIFYLPDVVEALRSAVANIQHEHRIQFAAIAALRGLARMESSEARDSGGTAEYLDIHPDFG